jgi:hypothetical protein
MQPANWPTLRGHKLFTELCMYLREESDRHRLRPRSDARSGLAREASSIPRWVWIHLMPRTIPLLRRLVSSNVHTPQHSGTNLAWLAVSANVEGVSGVYVELTAHADAKKSRGN